MSSLCLRLLADCIPLPWRFPLASSTPAINRRCACHGSILDSVRLVEPRGQAGHLVFVVFADFQQMPLEGGNVAPAILQFGQRLSQKLMVRNHHAVVPAAGLQEDLTMLIFHGDSLEQTRRPAFASRRGCDSFFGQPVKLPQFVERRMILGLRRRGVLLTPQPAYFRLGDRRRILLLPPTVTE